ncbi:unnamed protein product [Ceutorhynchus assimilis]|uniref:Uncharacterized protein n=1 Tax=Ceutorhynchus assimilis TaxID=467358 RepID=A0A9N9QJY7_9CUCU|nr:unnamed protein product [Ceutorhynchus assimilis]
MSGTFVQIRDSYMSRLPAADISMSNDKTQNNYGLPENYNPADHPPVKFRQHSHTDQSETQRKRRSKNRLSNRRSTGYVPPEVVEEAIKMGDQPTKND